MGWTTRDFFSNSKLPVEINVNFCPNDTQNKMARNFIECKTTLFQMCLKHTDGFDLTCNILHRDML
jgi:hypothetical protein